MTLQREMNRYRIIVNPTSGRGAGDRAVSPIKQMLQSHGLDFDVVRTERPWHAAELAEQATLSGYDVVVAVGGDGTANEVLNGLMTLPPLAGGQFLEYNTGEKSTHSRRVSS